MKLQYVKAHPASFATVHHKHVTKPQTSTTPYNKTLANKANST
jgi:hypothetical protein